MAAQPVWQPRPYGSPPDVECNCRFSTWCGKATEFVLNAGFWLAAMVEWILEGGIQRSQTRGRAFYPKSYPRRGFREKPLRTQKKRASDWHPRPAVIALRRRWGSMAGPSWGLDPPHDPASNPHARIKPRQVYMSSAILPIPRILWSVRANPKDGEGCHATSHGSLGCGKSNGSLGIGSLGIGSPPRSSGKPGKSVVSGLTGGGTRGIVDDEVVRETEKKAGPRQRTDEVVGNGP